MVFGARHKDCNLIILHTLGLSILELRKLSLSTAITDWEGTYTVPFFPDELLATYRFWRGDRHYQFCSHWRAQLDLLFSSTPTGVGFEIKSLDPLPVYCFVLWLRMWALTSRLLPCLIPALCFLPRCLLPETVSQNKPTSLSSPHNSVLTENLKSNCLTFLKFLLPG